MIGSVYPMITLYKQTNKVRNFPSLFISVVLVKILNSNMLPPIPRTLELFVESLLSKAMQVTMARNARTLSPSHVKQCILAESRFDFLRDLVKNIPDVSAAEEKETMSAENSPNTSRFPEAPAPPRRVVREDSNSSSSSDVRVQPISATVRDKLIRALSADTEPRPHRTETVTSTVLSLDTAMDLTKRSAEARPVRTANFYQETLLTDDVQHRSVITVNPTYASPQPSTSYTNLTPVEPVHKIEIAVPKQDYYVDMKAAPVTPRTPVTPILNIDFTKNLAKPEIKVLDNTVASMVGVQKETAKSNVKLNRQNSKVKSESRKVDLKPPLPQMRPIDIDHLNSGNLQIDEDYDT
ncbi:unnamed protein product [Diatraea saccharalis]|uniref:Transcription factor CBF/NF-Y/archaeal histone domain-containing protein n=1 Tax=Diatraea saccharalis TaxID=40085 RepID=A0A9N9R5J0_9NEOP|nr:unnamed protein product [Diatraea saccharalis]